MNGTVDRVCEEGLELVSAWHCSHVSLDSQSAYCRGSGDCHHPGRVLTSIVSTHFTQW